MAPHLHKNSCTVLIWFYRSRFCSPAINQISLYKFVIQQWEKLQFTSNLVESLIQQKNKIFQPTCYSADINKIFSFFLEAPMLPACIDSSPSPKKQILKIPPTPCGKPCLLESIFHKTFFLSTTWLAPQPTFGLYCGDGLTNSMLITSFFIFLLDPVTLQ